MKPDWDEMTAIYEGHKKVNIFDVDCTLDKNNAFCQEKGVKSYPTIKYYTDETGPEGELYEGACPAHPPARPVLLRTAAPLAPRRSHLLSASGAATGAGSSDAARTGRRARPGGDAPARRGEARPVLLRHHRGPQGLHAPDEEGPQGHDEDAGGGARREDRGSRLCDRGARGNVRPRFSPAPVLFQ